MSSRTRPSRPRLDLLAEVLVCAVPFQPLAWWAKRRLGQLSELACDDWAIAGGQEPEAYAGCC